MTDANDIVERLRKDVEHWYDGHAKPLDRLMVQAAADLIESLRAENDNLLRGHVARDKSIAEVGPELDRLIAENERLQAERERLRKTIFIVTKCRIAARCDVCMTNLRAAFAEPAEDRK